MLSPFFMVRLPVASADENASPSWTPRTDIHETDDAFLIRMDVPGVGLDQIEIELNQKLLVVRGVREADGQLPTTCSPERPKGAFRRAFQLPEVADCESISASGKNGVLEVRIGKKANPAPRRIQVTT